MSPGPLLLGAVLVQLASLLTSHRAPRLWLALTLTSSVALLAAAVAVFTGADATTSLVPAGWEFRSDFTVCGELLHLRLDALAAVFLALLAVVGGAGAVYARGYWPDRTHPQSARAGRLWWSVLLLSLVLVLVSSNGLHFLLGWELFTLAAYFLITLDRQRREVRAAGWLYLAASHAGTICLFAFFTLLAARTGSWELGPMRDNASLAPLFWLALLGFGLKSGMFPLHIWLPSAHANAPSHVSAILSGVTIKLGIYGLMRFSGWLPVPAAAGWVVAGVGVASAVLGVAFALGQHDLKRLLAYHSVENIGIILIGLGFALVAVTPGATAGSSLPNAGAWGRLALAGALLHVWNHGLFKALLFLGAGSVLHATGTREMSQLGGLARAMPWTAALFALGAAAICGLPPLNGFVSEWLVFLGLFDAAISHAPATWFAIPAAILLGVTGALALACFVKVCGIVFLGAPRSPAAGALPVGPALAAGPGLPATSAPPKFPAGPGLPEISAPPKFPACRQAAALPPPTSGPRECGWSMRAPMLLLATACVAIGLAPVLFWPAIARASAAWQPAWIAPDAPPVPLFTLGWCHVGLAALAFAAAAWLWHRLGRHGVRRALTWDCGYAVPTARMQYTAASFAATIVEWFEWILRPVRHEHRPEETDTFPAHASSTSHTSETVLTFVVAPVAAVVLRLSNLTRQLQHGRLQAYLLYLVLGLAALAALVMSGT